MGGKFVIGQSLDFKSMFGVERHGREVKIHRGFSQDLEPAMRRAEQLKKATFKKDWQWVGSIPMAVLLGWLRDNSISLDLYARDRDIRKRFIKWYLQNRDFSKLHNGRRGLTGGSV